MIKAICKSKLEQYENEKFPVMFCGIPEIGHLVQSENGIRLKIVSIIHCEGTLFGIEKKPYLKIELDRI